MSMKPNFGGKDIPLVFKGDQLIYPNYVKDGLVLHYDFSGMTNTDANKDIAYDLSGNGNHGTLQNFNYTAESGYDENKLLFDGVDDGIVTGDNPSLNIPNPLTLECVVRLPDVIDHIGDLIIKGTAYGVNQNYSISYHTNTALYFEVGSDDGVRNYVTLMTDGIKGKKIFIQGVCRNDGLYIYINGQQKAFNARVIDTIPTSTSPAGISVSESRKAKADVLSTKIYNRPLTPEEVAHNYAIEKERFGIE